MRLFSFLSVVKIEITDSEIAFLVRLFIKIIDCH